MKDEELEKAILELSQTIESLPESKVPLSRQEQRRRELLMARKEILGRIKAAKQKSQENEALYGSMVYGLLTSYGEKHPLLMYLANLKLNRWSLF